MRQDNHASVATPLSLRRQRLDRPCRVSFEFFPAKNAAVEEQLWAAIARLEPLNPTFVSVTYGAGGTTQDRTLGTVTRLVKDTSLKPAAHLTCVGASRGHVDDVLRAYWDAGVRHIVALRGDPQDGVGGQYRPHPEGYANAAALVVGAKKIAPFEISVAVYPERHPESPNWDVELDNLKRKIDGGATRGISQFFYDAEIFLRFRDRLSAAGINIPILPGIMPVSNFAGTKRMAAACGATLPAHFEQMFAGLDDDPQTRALVAAATTGELCADLAAEGVEDFHFYTLNRAELTLAICRTLGVSALRPSLNTPTETAA